MKAATFVTSAVDIEVWGTERDARTNLNGLRRFLQNIGPEVMMAQNTNERRASMIRYFAFWACEKKQLPFTALVSYLIVAFLTFGWTLNNFDDWLIALYAGLFWPIYIPGHLSVWMFS